MRKFNLCFFRGFLQTLQRHAVFAQVNVVCFLEAVDEPIHDSLIKVIAAKVRVAVGGLYLHDAAANFEHGNIERATAQVIHGDRFVGLLVESICQRGRRRFVDNADDFEARDFACLLGRLPLRVVEVRRNGDDGLGHFFAQEIFRGCFQLAENHR